LPGVDIGTSASFPEGLVMEIPGLCISNVETVLRSATLSASAVVTMMCGCKIGNSLPYWPPTDFVVELNTQTQTDACYSYTLDYNADSNILSSFTGTWQNQAPNDPVVKAWISASQPKLGNQGIYWVTDANADLLEDALLKNVHAFLQKHLD
jgi:hypothetical protein